MIRANQTFAYGFFADEGAATKAVDALLDAGFASEHIGALMLEGAEVKELPIKHKTAVGKGLAIGTLLGAALGAIALPGMGLVAFGGAFAHLAGAAAGGAAGSLAGVVGGMGVWKDELDIPRSAFERGQVLVGTLVPEANAERAYAVLERAGATSVSVSEHEQAKQALRHEPRA